MMPRVGSPVRSFMGLFAWSSGWPSIWPRAAARGCAVALLAAWVMRFYPLDDRALEQVQADLQARRETTDE